MTKLPIPGTVMSGSLHIPADGNCPVAGYNLAIAGTVDSSARSSGSASGSESAHPSAGHSTCNREPMNCVKCAGTGEQARDLPRGL